MTFDLKEAIPTIIRYNWQRWYEAFCVCRRCLRSTIFKLAQKETNFGALLEANPNLQFESVAINTLLRVEGCVTAKDKDPVAPPDHVPEEVSKAFREGATCMAVECWNAAGTMFRMCVDLTTRPMLPSGETPGLNSRIRRDLGLRLPWLFDNGYLPDHLRNLATCIREDGNDGAHAGILTKEEAEDLSDFTTALLERIFTEPKRLELAEQRRTARRAGRAE